MTSLGVFDSGVGGLSVLRHLRAQLPAVDLIYLADSGHVPYGPRPLAEVRAFSEAITRFLLAQGAQALVVACNTASAAALKHLRATFPATPFVGMEPAVKPAAEQTRTGVVGVLATPATFQGELFNSVVERFAQGVRVIPQICPGLVEQIEAGELDSPATEAMLRGWVEPMLTQDIDALVLGCTHYPFIIPLLEKIAGPGVRVIDPAPAVARQAVRVLNGPSAPAGARQTVRVLNGAGEQGDGGVPGKLIYYTTGDRAVFQQAVTRFGAEPAPVRTARWDAGGLAVAD